MYIHDSAPRCQLSQNEQFGRIQTKLDTHLVFNYGLDVQYLSRILLVLLMRLIAIFKKTQF